MAVTDKANLAAGDRTVVWLEYAGVRLSLLLVYDPDAREQALARGFGYALSYQDRNLASAVRDVVLSAASAFNGREGSSPRPREVVDVLADLFPADAILSFRCTVPAGQHLPRWPGTLRTGPALSLAQGLWPFDPELAAMRAGWRRLAKRDWLTPSQQKKDAAWLSQNDVFVRSAETADSRGRFALFAARDADTLATALDAEAALGASDAERESASAWLGDALGYPPCCVQTFQRLGRRDDLTLAIELLPVLGSPAASPLAQWLNGPLALISHIPCSLDCSASMALAKGIVGELDQDRPGFAAAWEGLARRIQLVDVRGRCLALSASGDLTGEVKVDDAVMLSVPDDHRVSELIQPAEEFVGQTLRNVDGELIGPGLRAVFVADHRG